MNAILALLKSKTLWGAVTAVSTAGGAYASGEASGIQAVQLGLTAAVGLWVQMVAAKKF